MAVGQVVERRASIIKKTQNAKPRGVLDDLFANTLIMGNASLEGIQTLIVFTALRAKPWSR